MVRPKGENVIRKHFKLTEETAKLLAKRSRAENMNESEYIRYLLLNQSENPRSRELEVEVMRLRNEINKIGVNINQIVKNNNSQFYRKDDKMNLISQIAEIKSIVQILTEKLLN
ncbi:MAG: plasmid mobilization protein [Roseburia sp. 1XD42-69]